MRNPSVELRHGIASDLAAILALERATDVAPHWPPASYAAIVGDRRGGLADAAAPRRCLFVALRDELLVGFAVGVVHSIPTDRATLHGRSAAELESVVVAASTRRSGIGSTLCRAAFDWCKSKGATEVVLEVRAAGTEAIALYCALGFKRIGRRPRYYRDPEDDALLMCLQLEG